MVRGTLKPFLLKDWLIAILLGLAAAHCVRSIFLVNVSLIDLPKYALGSERMPFQGRIVMMPVLLGPITAMQCNVRQPFLTTVYGVRRTLRCHLKT